MPTSLNLRVYGGYCEGCETYFVGVEVNGVEVAMKHGLTEKDAYAKWEEIQAILKAPMAAVEEIGERLNQVYKLLGMPGQARVIHLCKQPDYERHARN